MPTEGASFDYGILRRFYARQGVKSDSETTGLAIPRPGNNNTLTQGVFGPQVAGLADILEAELTQR